MHSWKRASFDLASIVLAVALASPSPATAQGMHFERGESGIVIGGGLATFGGLSDYTMRVGGSFGGVFDVGLGLTFAARESRGVTDRIGAAPSVALHLRKQSPSRPISVAVSAAYLYDQYRGPSTYAHSYSSGPVNRKSRGYGVAGALYHTMGSRSSVRVTPRLALSYIKRSASSGTSFQFTTAAGESPAYLFGEEDASITAITPGLTFAFGLPGGQSFTTDLSMPVVSTGEVATELSLGLVVPLRSAIH